MYKKTIFTRIKIPYQKYDSYASPCSKYGSKEIKSTEGLGNCENDGTKTEQRIEFPTEASSNEIRPPFIRSLLSGL